MDLLKNKGRKVQLIVYQSLSFYSVRVPIVNLTNIYIYIYNCFLGYVTNITRCWAWDTCQDAPLGSQQTTSVVGKIMHPFGLSAHVRWWKDGKKHV